MAQRIELHIGDYNQVYDYALKHQDHPTMKFLVDRLQRAQYVKNDEVDKKPQIPLEETEIQ